LTDLPDFGGDDVEIVAREDITHPPTEDERSIARHSALQILYEVDCAHHAVGTAINSHLIENKLSPKSTRFMQSLVTGVVNTSRTLDRHIQPFATDFPLDQLSIVDRTILRMALYEFAAYPNTPLSVIIAEATEMANLFGADGSTRFVNGVLASLLGAAPATLRAAIVPQPTDTGDEEDHATEAQPPKPPTDRT
jgi:N utilization substance protein B